MIAFSSYFASKRAAKFGVFFIVFGTTLLLPLDSAGATQTGPVQVICAKPDGEQRTFTPSWDNANSFFNGRGQISRLFCEGGYAGAYTVFISNNLTDSSLDYYNGIVPVVNTPQVDSPTVVAESETPTSVSDSSTAQTQPVSSDSQTVETQTAQSAPDTSTVTVSDTQTVQVDSPTVGEASDSQTVTNQNQNPDTSTAVTVPESASVISPSSRDDSSTTLTVTDSQTVTLETSTLVSDTPTVILPEQSPAQNQPIEPQPSPSPSPAPSVSEPVVVAPAPVVEPTPPAPAPDPVIVQPDIQPVEPLPIDPIPAEEVEPEPAQPIEPVEPVEPSPNPEPTIDPIQVDLVPDLIAKSEPVELPVQQNQSQVSENSPVFESSSPAPVSVLSVDVATLPPDTPVELENGVILEAGVVVALELLDNPGELLASILTDPAQALKAIANIGADMTPEDRKKAQTTTVAAVLTGAAIRRMN